LALTGSILLGCSAGFKVQEPPPNQIISIRNTGDTASQADPSKAQPYPLPILPAVNATAMQLRSYILRPAQVVNGEATIPISKSNPGVVSIADVNISPYDRFTFLSFKEGTTPYNCTAEFVVIPVTFY
jgi:hypothetical protein